MRIALITLFSILYNLGFSQNIIPTFDQKKYWIKLEVEDNETTRYIAKYEVSNHEYREFLNALKSDIQEDYMPIHENWLNVYDEDIELKYQDRMAEYYFEHSAFNEYPVVNISYEAAELYAKWLTSEYNKGKSKKVLIRIPTEEEWMTSAKELFPDLLGEEPTFKGTKEENLVNLKGKEDGNPYTNPRNQKKQSKSKIYNLLGNVAEMTSTAYAEDTTVKIAKGCHFMTKPESCNITLRTRFKESNPMIGFRLLMEIQED